MAIKTILQIEQMIYGALEKFFEGEISGLLYTSGLRPLDSELEDAVINVGSTSAEQIQEGSVNLNIYVKDIDNNSGRLVPDKGRLDELSMYAEDVVEILNGADTDFEFWRGRAVEYIAEPNINQHFVNINLNFKCITF